VIIVTHDLPPCLIVFISLRKNYNKKTLPTRHPRESGGDGFYYNSEMTKLEQWIPAFAGVTDKSTSTL
jgi:hypothetical protein